MHVWDGSTEINHILFLKTPLQAIFNFKSQDASQDIEKYSDWHRN